MNTKQLQLNQVIRLTTIAVLVAVTMITSLFAITPNAAAYQCPGKMEAHPSYEPSFPGYDQRYNNGVCEYITYNKTDPASNAGGVPTCKSGSKYYTSDPNPRGSGNGSGGGCYETHYTSEAGVQNGNIPVHDDGTPSVSADWSCKGKDTYNTKTGQCDDPACSASNIVGNLVNGRIGCGKSYDPTQAREDPTSKTVTDCTSTGATFNTSTHSCNWTADTCTKQSQGVWVDNSCHQYSDFTNQADCTKAGGDFKITGQNNGNDTWTCVKPGTNGNPQPGSGTPKTQQTQAQDTSDVGTCGTHGTKDTPTKTVLIKTGNVDGCTGNGVLLIGGLLKFVLTTLTIGIGIVAVGGIAYGALLYSSARGNAGQTQQAIGIIRNVVIGLLMYIFMISILNYLVPGGVIG